MPPLFGPNKSIGSNEIMNELVNERKPKKTWSPARKVRVDGAHRRRDRCRSFYCVVRIGELLLLLMLLLLLLLLLLQQMLFGYDQNVSTIVHRE